MTIPEKSIFKVDEVCRLTGIKPYVLRFWETEFESINPITSSSGKKLYERGDLKNIFEIKKLLFEEQMTVEQAKQSLINGDHLVSEPLMASETKEPQIDKSISEQIFEPRKTEIIEAKIVDIPELETAPVTVDNPGLPQVHSQQNEEAKVLVRELLSDISSIKQRYNWL